MTIAGLVESIRESLPKPPPGQTEASPSLRRRYKLRTFAAELEPGRNGFLIPNREDVYQMLAYAAAYQCERLTLIYPWHDGLSGVRESVLEMAPLGDLRPRLHVLCIDVRDGRFDAVLEGLALVNGATAVA